MNAGQIIEACLRSAGSWISIRDIRLMTGLPYKTVYYYLNESDLAISVEKDYFTVPHSYRIV